MTEEEIKDIIIACVDYAAEYERYPKDIMNEMYQFIDNWRKPIEKEYLETLATDYACENHTVIYDFDVDMYGHFVTHPPQFDDYQSIYDAYKAGYTKAHEE